MKKISFLAAIALSVTLSAQENNVVNNKEVDELKKKMTDVKMAEKDTTYWKKGGVFGLNFSQVSLTNWSGGGQNSVSVNGLVNLFATHKGKHHVWDNTLNLAYGMLQQGNENMRKTDDKIEFMSIPDCEQDSRKLMIVVNIQIISQVDQTKLGKY